MLPGHDRLGQTGTWLISHEDGELEVEGRFVGFGSSHSPYHTQHSADRFAEVGAKCQACRWLEIRIYDDGEEFTVSYVGVSSVPGETQRAWFMRATSEDDLVDLLSGDGRSGRFFSKPARLVIESARKVMPEIGEAYVEHPGHPARSR
jgi:hypothetical protein